MQMHSEKLLQKVIMIMTEQVFLKFILMKTLFGNNYFLDFKDSYETLF